MAKSSRGGGKGVNIKVDTVDLETFANKLRNSNAVVPTAISVSLNEMGDQLTSLVASNFSRSTGLPIEQVRGLMKVRRSKKSDLVYEVLVDKGLLEDNAQRKLEGRRENRDFGKRQPGALVIVVSQKDELVCMDCEELEAAGPMPVEIANRHVPKHPNCRCVIMPYVPKGRRMSVTMTTVSGTDPRRRMGGKSPLQGQMTVRQMAQKILDGSTRRIRIQLGK